MPVFPVRNWDRGNYRTGVRSFGANRSGGRRKHAAVDLYAPVGSPVCAVEDGTVVEAGAFYLGTWAVVVRHAGFVARYGEVQPRLAPGITAGASVKAGDVLGYVGRMNGLNISMLHFEMYRGTEAGPLTRRDLMPFQRRADLMNPTEYVDGLRGLTPPVRQTESAPPSPPTPGELPVRAGGNSSINIRGSVGRAGSNRYADVKKIQWLLNVAKQRLSEASRRVLNFASLKEDGICGPRTRGAIAEFQRAVAGFRTPDERIDPGGRTLRMLNAAIRGATATTPTRVAQQRREEARRPAQNPAAGGNNNGGVTAEQIAQIQPALAGRAAAVASDLNQAMRDAQISTRVGQAMFLAQMIHEMGTRSDLNEGGGKKRYNGQVYDYFFLMYDKDSPDPNRRRVAARLGNTQTGDGARFHGRGYVQLTGRDNYQRAGSYLNIDLVGNPDRAAEPAVAVRTAAWYWRFGNGNLNNFTREDTSANFDEVTRRINGGLTHIERRRELYARAKQALGI